MSFDVHPGETLGLVGESGCGKSVTALSIVRLVDEPPGRTEPGSQVVFRGEDLVGADPRRLRRIRGAGIGFVFQEPMTSLNPVHRVGRQIEEALRAHEDVPARAARARALDMLARVELPDPLRAARAYPHELSGGMRQRALIAMAMVCRPALLIADEPTTALDVTVQARVLTLLRSLQEEMGLALLLISHDLAVVSRVAGRAAVMYAGQIVEMGPVGRVLGDPRHPYTEGLLRAIPSVDRPDRGLAVIPGRVPDPEAWPEGCRFHPRCPYAWERCAAESPPFDGDAPGGSSRCWLETEPRRREGRGYAEIGA
ncbi:MAG: ABC transporter ATP-binding protein [Gemmatimonadota bacterium]|nr:ABC transporter ATP-binding protein [Gemmatimonadota bacterium]